MKIRGDTQIVRTFEGLGPEIQEFEIPVAYIIEEMYKGSETEDDPSECVINERVLVLEDVGPFRIGDKLLLTDGERRDLEEEELHNAL